MYLPNGSLQLIDGVPKVPFVAGGSGRLYYTINDAQIQEQQAFSFADTTQAGTTDGVIFGSAGVLPAADDALNGAIVVLTAAVPGNGIAAVYARVVDYIGATRKMILDTPVNFGLTKTFVVFMPILITVDGPLTEDVTFSGKNVILNLGGNVLTGQVNIAQGNFIQIMNGTITKGIQDTRSVVGALRLDNMIVEPRDANGYALKKTNASNIGSIEAYDCDFRGIVAGQQGICRWVIHNCVNIGFNDADGNYPYRLLEADAIALTFSNVSVNILGDFGGAIFFAKGTGSIASAAPNFLSLFANINGINGDVSGVNASPRHFSMLSVIGAGVATVNVTAGQIAISGTIPNNGNGTDTALNVLDFALLRGKDLTGSGTLTLAPTPFISLDLSNFYAMSSMVTVEGTANMTGTLTLNGATRRTIMATQQKVAIVLVRGAITTGSVSVSSGGYSVRGARYLAPIYFAHDETASTPAITISSDIDGTEIGEHNPFGFDSVVASISVGTWTVSGHCFITGCGHYECFVSSVVSGGTWVMSGNVALTMTGDGSDIINICTHGGSGGTLTVAGEFRASGGIASAFRHSRASVSGGTANRTGKTYLSNMEIVNAFTAVLSVAGATCDGSGEIHLRCCQFRQANAISCTIVTAGGTSVGPAFVAMDYCLFELGVVTSDGAGTLTWANAQWAMSHSSIFGLFTIVGDPFLAMTFWFDTFWGDTNDFSIAFSGARPTFYRFWKCNFGARNDGGLPEIIDDYVEVPNDANAKTRGELQVVDASGQAVDPAGASTDALEGVVLGDVAASAGDAVRLVRRGKIFVDVDAGVAAGDNLVEDFLGTPTQAKAGTSVVGQRVGRALEAAGATNTGEAYSIVNLM